MKQNTPSFTWDSYVSMWLPLVMEGVSKKIFTIVFQMLLSVECYGNVKGVELWIVCTPLSVNVLVTLARPHHNI
jgi:hypothetical protein